MGRREEEEEGLAPARARSPESSAPFEAISHKRMGPNRREISYSKGGKVVLTIRTRVSGDGKTMTATVKGTSAQGQPVDGVAVYEKQ